MNAMGPPYVSRCSTQAIWMRSSLPSVEALGSSAKSGSSQTQRCRSVKRTPSGSTSGCASARRSASSSASSQVSFITASQLLEAPLDQHLAQGTIHDPPGEWLGLAAERLDRVADRDVVLTLPRRLERGHGRADAIGLLREHEPALAGERLAR